MVVVVVGEWPWVGRSVGGNGEDWRGGWWWWRRKTDVVAERDGVDVAVQVVGGSHR